MIDFKCQSCGTAVRVPDDMAGKKGKCRKCGTTVQVPSVSGANRNHRRKPAKDEPRMAAVLGAIGFFTLILGVIAGGLLFAKEVQGGSFTTNGVLAIVCFANGIAGGSLFFGLATTIKLLDKIAKNTEQRLS